MPQNKQRLLTKSLYVGGLQCEKYLWLAFNKPEALPRNDKATQHRFDEGKAVGDLAKNLFPDGVEIGELDSIKNDKRSKELIKERRVLFEAGFIHKNGKCYARADVLVPVGKDEWDIYEVKSATSVKEDYFEDVSFQKYCYESIGLKIRKCVILHVNNQYIRKGKINPKDFFVEADITEEVSDIMPLVNGKIDRLFEVIAKKECPEITSGNYCKDPFNVHFDDKFLTEHPSDIFDLYRGGKVALELFNSGVLEIKDIPEYHKLNVKQKIQRKTSVEGKHHIAHKELNVFINSLKYPLYFLDFESYNTAIPLYDDLKPYQQVPFQFSLHVAGKKGKPEHHSFIAEGAGDPRQAFLEELLKVMGSEGSVVVYNQSFEQGVLANLADLYPKHSKAISGIIARMSDLLVPFREFSYYHPEQKGSASIKHVLPVLTGLKYDDLEISAGDEASLSYLYMIRGDGEGNKASPQEAKKIKDNLEKYCGLDTHGMIMILDKLKELVEK